MERRDIALAEDGVEWDAASSHAGRALVLTDLDLLGGAVPLEDASRHRANCSGFDIAGVRSSRGLDE